jgi:peroxiredoxin Q/BCP
MLKEGDLAPDFTARDASGNEIKLSDFRGKRVVLYFYPKDDTPGCTKEACSFRDAYARFEERGIKVLGVSLDTEESHRQFASKYNLPFTLLSDPDHRIGDAYGTYGKHVFGDKEYWTNARKTFLIDEEGRIKKIFDKVDVERHADEVLEAFER